MWLAELPWWVRLIGLCAVVIVVAHWAGRRPR